MQEISSLKVRLEVNKSTITNVGIETSGITNHIWREKNMYYSLLDKVQMIDKKYCWEIRKLKEAAYI